MKSLFSIIRPVCFYNSRKFCMDSKTITISNRPMVSKVSHGVQCGVFVCVPNKVVERSCIQHGLALPEYCKFIMSVHI